MVENQSKQIPCAFEPTKICPSECCFNKLCKISSDRYGVPSETASAALIDVLKEREEAYSKLCEQRNGQELHRSGIQALKVSLQEHLRRV